jgi:hypothetical protein
MKCSMFKSRSGTELNKNNSTIQGLHTGPYDVQLGLHGAEFLVTSQSLGGVSGHTYLPQDPSYSDISAHNLIYKQSLNN